MRKRKLAERILFPQGKHKLWEKGTYHASNTHPSAGYGGRLRGKEYLPLAYFEGAAPENSYTPAQPYVLNVLPDPRPQDMEPGYLRLFLQTAGADSPRPIKLRQKPSTGEWFLWEYSSPLSGIRIPAAQDPWA